ncbi:sucrase ferredoxin [Corynebacterium sp. 335C]
MADATGACSDSCAPRRRTRKRPPRCADVSAAAAEPLPGTAKAARLFILLEHTSGWSRDILDGGVFGDGDTARIEAWLAERGGALQLIRKPGRLGQIECAGLTVFVAHCPPDVDGPGGAWMEQLTVADLDGLLGLDIRLGRPTPGGRRVHHPLMLVCTHGKRDVCCAVKGRPMAKHLNDVYPGLAWETSHSKGHRFAPTMILLPGNYSYGRIPEDVAVEVLEAAAEGRLDPAGCRGRGTWSAQGQVAELAVRQRIGAWGLDDVIRAGVGGGGGDGAGGDGAGGGVVDAWCLVELADGRRFRVGLERVVTEGVISSCGDEPGPKKGWRAASVEEL